MEPDYSIAELWLKLTSIGELAGKVFNLGEALLGEDLVDEFLDVQGLGRGTARAARRFH